MPTICCFITSGVIDAVHLRERRDRHGTFGVGGATGDGHAANAGYHGMPGTLTVAVYVSHAVPMHVRDRARVLHLHRRRLRALREDQRRPRRADDLPPTRSTALIMTPTIVAAVCHWLHAEQIALADAVDERADTWRCASSACRCGTCSSTPAGTAAARRTAGAVAFSSGLNASP